MSAREILHKIFNRDISDYEPPVVHNYLEPEKVFSSDHEREVQQTAEREPEIERFSPETREALEGYGFRIYELTGKSMSDFRKSELYGFWHAHNFNADKFPQTFWARDFPRVKDTPSRRTEVAIMPGKVFLRGSRADTLTEERRALAHKEILSAHRQLVKKYSEVLSEKIPGAKAIIGQAPDYVQLSHRHKVETLRDDGKDPFNRGERLFKGGYTNTETILPDIYGHEGNEGAVTVGNDDPKDFGLSVYNDYIKKSLIFVAPLVVPDNSK